MGRFADQAAAEAAEAAEAAVGLGGGIGVTIGMYRQ